MTSSSKWSGQKIQNTKRRHFQKIKKEMLLFNVQRYSCGFGNISEGICAGFLVSTV